MKIFNLQLEAYLNMTTAIPHSYEREIRNLRYDSINKFHENRETDFYLKYFYWKLIFYITVSGERLQARIFYWIYGIYGIYGTQSHL